MPSESPKFAIGQLVHHHKFDYRGVVVDVDLSFSLTDEWYEQMARSRPPKEHPWYRVLVDGTAQESYVAERHLEPDAAGGPVRNPRLGEFFDAFRDGHYLRERNLN